ncbi:adenylate/guanylate cyclase domain-containing protein [Mesorhizobium hawassense]|uniref:adenylate/guanylate cyclase domain-containing protein n=1 Tax=Mesorhizobium hawassense TaxID=1209954 RepID=UPI001FE093E7|nr:adenylate/guanylate cyclase domain-containing protein [Mesorhizobium hawassense]
MAVFAADVEGYSRLMGADELGTLKALTERRTILDKAIADQRGRIANTAGDSVLAEFGRAVDAVQCAVEAQAALAEANAGLSSDKRINFRIGIHVGDVMVRAGDLFGDGVNIAARLQALAQPGGVCVSGETYGQVRKVLPIAFTDLVAQQVKNIEQPVRTYAATGLGETAGVVAIRSEMILKPLSLPDKPSIAVLPFQNMSRDPDQEYFADGMVEDIITALSRFKWLFVIARNSTFTYKGRTVDVRQVGRELGVRYVLEGSVRKATERVRITAQLVDAEISAHIWADCYDRAVDNIFALQDEIILSTVAAIEPSVRQAEIERAKRKRPENLDAYDLVLRATPLVDTGMPEGASQAVHSLSAHFYLSRTTRLRAGKRHFATRYCISEREGVKTIAERRDGTRILQWRLVPTMHQRSFMPQSRLVLWNITASWLRRRSRLLLQSPHRQRGHILGAC